MNLDAKIEAILFFKAEPVAIATLSRLLQASESEIEIALTHLNERLKDRGIRLTVKDKQVALGTAPELGAFLKELAKAELAEELSKAALETLTIVLYRGPIHKASIDFIRGVNSQFILRNLLVRGLIERVPDTKDKRILLYRPTFDLLGHVGITKIEDLPEYETVIADLKTFEETWRQETQETENTKT